VNLQTGAGPWQTDGYVREATVDLLFNAPTSFERVEIGTCRVTSARSYAARQSRMRLY
jgi:hypothetical protein